MRPHSGTFIVVTLLAMLATGCSHPMQIHGPRIRPGTSIGVVLPGFTRASPGPGGAPRHTVRVLPVGGFFAWTGRLEDEGAWKPGWLLGAHLLPFDLLPRATGYVELTNPTSPVTMGVGTTLGHNIGQLYAMGGVARGGASVFGVVRATSHHEPRQSLSATVVRPLTSTTATGGGIEIPIVQDLTMRLVMELTKGRRVIPGRREEIRHWIVTFGFSRRIP